MFTRKIHIEGVTLSVNIIYNFPKNVSNKYRFNHLYAETHVSRPKHAYSEIKSFLKLEYDDLHCLILYPSKFIFKITLIIN